jgi:predicted metal-dependent hydrolase
MSYTYDVTTDIGLVRLRINDRVQATAVFSDEELQAFLTAENGVLRASAAALETEAATAGLNSKSISVMQLKVDTTKKIDGLLSLAAEYRRLAVLDDAQLGNNFDWAEFVDDDFSARERIEKELLRESA